MKKSELEQELFAVQRRLRVMEEKYGQQGFLFEELTHLKAERDHYGNCRCPNRPECAPHEGIYDPVYYPSGCLDHIHGLTSRIKVNQTSNSVSAKMKP